MEMAVRSRGLIPPKILESIEFLGNGKAFRPES